jgi:hypothetical protein
LAASASLAVFSNSTFAAAAFPVSVTYLVVAFTAFVTPLATLSKVPSTPVYISIYSLPAFFTSSNAPAKSPANTFLTALAINPRVSKKLSNLSMIFSLTKLPNVLREPIGSSNIALKKSVQ